MLPIKNLFPSHYRYSVTNRLIDFKAKAYNPHYLLRQTNTNPPRLPNSRYQWFHRSNLFNPMTQDAMAHRFGVRSSSVFREALGFCCDDYNLQYCYFTIVQLSQKLFAPAFYIAESDKSEPDDEHFAVLIRETFEIEFDFASVIVDERRLITELWDARYVAERYAQTCYESQVLEDAKFQIAENKSEIKHEFQLIKNLLCAARVAWRNCGEQIPCLIYKGIATQVRFHRNEIRKLRRHIEQLQLSNGL